MGERPIVLIVDDEINILRSLQRLLRKEPYEVRVAPSSEEGLTQMAQQPPAVVISDYVMPDQNGLEFLKGAQEKCPDAIRVILSGYADLNAILAALNKGQIYHYITKPWDDELLKIEIRKFVERWALLKHQRDMDQNMIAQLNSTVEVLSTLPHLKDPKVAGKTERVRKVCLLIGGAYPLSAEGLRELEMAARLHDVGNIGVSSAILNKPGSLTPEERKEVEQHVIIPQFALQPMKTLDSVCRVIRHHHESFDGTGYPDHLKGEDIPVASRILCVAEAFDAFLSDRPFRKALPLEEALMIVKREDGLRFDPKIVSLLIDQIHSPSSPL